MTDATQTAVLIAIGTLSGAVAAGVGFIGTFTDETAMQTKIMTKAQKKGSAIAPEKAAKEANSRRKLIMIALIVAWIISLLADLGALIVTLAS
jgi:hypothetical protein